MYNYLNYNIIFVVFIECGVPNREARFLGGEFLRTYEFPWLAVLHIPDRTKFRQVSTPTNTSKPADFPHYKKSTIPATLINNKYLLTGASALVNLTPYEIKVALGHFDRCFSETSSTNISVSKIIIHPDFSPKNRAHDIALIQLTRPIPIERRIAPVCLAFPGK